jgi:hypothetical protein
MNQPTDVQPTVIRPFLIGQGSPFALRRSLSRRRLHDQPLINGYVRDMANVDDILTQVFDGQPRLTGDEIFRRVTAAGADPDVIDQFRLFPQGEYSPEEAAYTFSELAGPGPEVAAAAAADADARTGADQPWDAEDLAVAEGRDPTPANVERARRELAEDGPAAIERTVP